MSRQASKASAQLKTAMSLPVTTAAKDSSLDPTAATWQAFVYSAVGEGCPLLWLAEKSQNL